MANPAKSNGTPKIMHARQVCGQINARAVIVIALNEESVSGASYGQTKEECGHAARTMDQIIDLIERGKVTVWKSDSAKPCKSFRASGDEEFGVIP